MQPVCLPLSVVWAGERPYASTELGRSIRSPPPRSSFLMTQGGYLRCKGGAASSTQELLQDHVMGLDASKMGARSHGRESESAVIVVFVCLCSMFVSRRCCICQAEQDLSQTSIRWAERSIGHHILIVAGMNRQQNIWQELIWVGVPRWTCSSEADCMHPVRNGSCRP